MPTDDKPTPPGAPRRRSHSRTFRGWVRRLSELPEQISQGAGRAWDSLLHTLRLRSSARRFHRAVTRLEESASSNVGGWVDESIKRSGLKAGARRVQQAMETGSETVAEKTSIWQERLFQYSGLKFVWARTARLRAWFDATFGGWIHENITRHLARTGLWKWAVTHKASSAGLAIVAGLLVTAGLWFGIPAFEQHKADHFTGLARRQLEAREPRKAIFLARKALSLYSRHAGAARVIAEVADLNNSPAALIWYQRAALVEPATSNRLVLALAALRYEPPPYELARRTLEEIDPAGQRTAAYQRAWAELALKQSNLDEAGSRLEQALAAEPGDDLTRLSLATLRLSSKDTNTAAQGLKELEALAAHPDLGLSACRTLARSSRVTGHTARAQLYSEKVLAHPKSVFTDRLEHLLLLRQTTNGQFAPFLAGLQKEALASPDTVASLAGWMTTSGLAAESLEWMAALPQTLQTNPTVLVARAGAHAVRKDWTGLLGALETQDWGVVDFLRLAMRSRALENLQRPAESAAEWKRATDLACARPETLITFYRTLESWGWRRWAAEVLWLLAERNPGETWPTRLLVQSCYQRNDTAGLHGVFTLLNQRAPLDLAAKNNLALLSLLLATNLPAAHQMAREVCDAKPHDPTYVSTLAYSLHLQGKTAAGLDLMNTLQPASLQSPGVAAYYGVLLAASGHKDQSKTFLEKALTERLLPEEKQLVVKASEP